MLINVMVGYDYFNYHLRKALGDNPPPLDPNNPLNRSETADGVPVDPHDMLIGAALGHARRVVLDSTGVVLDMGRRQRLFTGPLRDAVMMTNTSCI